MLQFHGCTGIGAEETLSEMAGLSSFGAAGGRVDKNGPGGRCGTARLLQVSRRPGEPLLLQRQGDILVVILIFPAELYPVLHTCHIEGQ
jgi:hypothetical protein